MEPTNKVYIFYLYLLLFEESFLWNSGLIEPCHFVYSILES